MISLITRYILFIQLIFNGFTTFSISVKTYQVKRINGSSYVVTSIFDHDHNSENNKRYLEQKDSTSELDRLIPLMDNKGTTEDFETTTTIISTVTVGEKKEKLSPKITPEFIQRARDYYFHTFFSSLGKINTTLSLLPETLTLSTVENNNSNALDKLDQNLKQARKYAAILISEGQYNTEKNIQNLYSENRKRKRNLNRLPKHTAKHKYIWTGPTRKYNMGLLRTKRPFRFEINQDMI